MNQILHIFKKDTRRHWPELLISLALLCLYAYRQVKFPGEFPSSFSVSAMMFWQLSRLITPILVLFWGFLIVRVVQSESLVGDRQWWVTKPYIWWQLFFAKLLFILAVISVPLFFMQVFILHHAGHSALGNLPGVFLLQLTLPLYVVSFSLLLACLTKNVGQALIGVGLFFVAILTFTWVKAQNTHNVLGTQSRVVVFAQVLLTFAPFFVLPVWQFARRQTWLSRGTLLASLGAASIVSFIPVVDHAEQSSPLVAAADAPIHFVIPSIPPAKEGQPALPATISDVPLAIPVDVSGVVPGSMILVSGIKITSVAAGEPSWNAVWSGQYLLVWPEDQRKELSYTINRKEYEAIKATPLTLHIQLLLSEYQEADPRTLVLTPLGVRDDYLGTCRLVAFPNELLQCQRPFRTPSFIARFDAPNSACLSSEERAKSLVAYSWSPENDGLLPNPGLSPIADYTMFFNDVTPRPDSQESEQPRYHPTSLCSGAQIQLSRPILKRTFRIQFDIPNTRLQNLVRPNVAAMSTAIGIDMRP
jgi:hypothetical protein